MKILENETILNFKKTPIGNIEAEQVDLKQLEISKSLEKEYRNNRNRIIVELHKIKLRYSEISNLQLQDIDNSFCLIRIKRGDRVFRIAISKDVSDGLKILTKYKCDKDYIFTKNLIDDKPLSRTMITKIIKNYNSCNDDNLENKYDDEHIDKEVYTVERVCNKYILYKENKPIDGLVINSMINAVKICEILNKDIYK